MTISDLTSLLAGRLGINLFGIDYWATAELEYHVRNAIREFQVLTDYWRSRLRLQVTANDVFYDLHASLIPRTVRDTDILAQVGYHLLEYAGSGPYVSTSQFDIGMVQAALGQQSDRMLGETRLTITSQTLPGPSPTISRMTLNPSVIQIHRAEWQDTQSGQWSLLDRTDDISAFGFSFGWPQHSTIPLAYAVSATPPFQVDLIPPPSAVGILSLLVTTSQGYTGAPATLKLCDDSTFALPWAVMASVLRQDSQSRDFQRADYARQRFEAALGVLKTFPCVLQSWPEGIQQPTSTLFDLDHWQSGWRNRRGAPEQVVLGGRNLVAVSPTPDARYDVPLDCIGNSPASGSSGASFSCADDIVTALVDNAYHAATFKLAGPEFLGTIGSYQAFLAVAQSYASRERAEAINWKQLQGVTELENKQVPYELVTEAR